MRLVGCATVNFGPPTRAMNPELELRVAPADSVTSPVVIRLKAALATNVATS
jgi:hypothetical protein